MRTSRPAVFLAATLAAAVCGGPVRAASHSDAPLIKQDPQANLTDVYAFVGNNTAGTKVLNVIAHVRPFCEPGDGVTYDRFAPDARYSIHLTDPKTGRQLRRYDFQFSGVDAGSGDYKNLDTILSYGRGSEIGAINDVGDARQNYVQHYIVSRVNSSSTTAKASPISRGLNLVTPPPNVGKRTTPFYNDENGVAVSGATTADGLDKYTKETVFNLSSGETVFAGMRDDGFYADIPGISDLLDPRILGSSLGQAGGGVDGFKGYNTLAYAIQIPLSSIGISGLAGRSPHAGGQLPNSTVGVYASVSRPRVTLRDSRGVRGSGSFVQVNRMGNPLFNEALVALRDKDRFNSLPPTSDAAFDKYARNPELAVLINTVFGTNFQTTGRTDLVGIFIPEVLKVDTLTDPVPLPGQAGFSRLSFIGGDTTNGRPSGWPNGRRIGDDVIDIALTAIASGPSFTTITVVGDNVPANDEVYNQVFPFSATPHAGTRNSKDSGINKQLP